LKKCKPSTRLGFLIAAAIFMIWMPEVFDASTAPGSVTISSSSAKQPTGYDTCHARRSCGRGGGDQ
jgi:hypothetical protein